MTRRSGPLAILFAALCVAATVPARAADAPLKVVTTIPDLGDLARQVGGDAVSVFSMVPGPQDPHFIDARPSFIKQLSEADVFLIVGMEMEVGYLPAIVQNARNARVIPGGLGYVDASAVITPLQIPTVSVDRSLGDVHPLGNPHYLLDPVNGVKVAELIRNTFQHLRPAQREYFAARFQTFRDKVAKALVGEELAAKYDALKLARLDEHGKLGGFLKSQGDGDKLRGWLGAVRPYRGTKVVDDHNMWPYFAQRFGIHVIGDLEPRPGLPPTTRHLRKLIDAMRAEGVQLIMAAPYYDARHARFIAEATGARVVEMAHQVNGRPEADDYYNMIDLNVRGIVRALEAANADAAATRVAGEEQ
jgi:ABC-type Zn uptake system ZnuABC Zn-binding protein ZnuA